jgi:hypothetical protein
MEIKNKRARDLCVACESMHVIFRPVPISRISLAVDGCTFEISSLKLFNAGPASPAHISLGMTPLHVADMGKI